MPFLLYLRNVANSPQNIFRNLLTNSIIYAILKTSNKENLKLGGHLKMEEAKKLMEFLNGRVNDMRLDGRFDYANQYFDQLIGAMGVFERLTGIKVVFEPDTKNGYTKLVYKEA